MFARGICLGVDVKRLLEEVPSLKISATSSSGHEGMFLDISNRFRRDDVTLWGPWESEDFSGLSRSLCWLSALVIA